MSSPALPRFERPPLVEMLLGVQFGPLEPLGSAILGAFWRTLGPDWPFVKDAPPLEEQFERFGDDHSWGGATLRLKLSQEPQTRLQISKRDRDRMIQVQNGRFLYNWLRTTPGEYPHYDHVRPEFDERFAGFKTFLEREGMGRLEVNQWEVTYVNHIPRGELWNDAREWGNVFPWMLAPPPGAPQLRLESGSFRWFYELPQRRGRLHVQIGHQKHPSPPHPEFLIFTLTARGPVGRSEGSQSSWGEGLVLGHQAVVTTFKDLTSERAHSHWRLIHAGACK